MRVDSTTHRGITVRRERNVKVKGFGCARHRGAAATGVNAIDTGEICHAPVVAVLPDVGEFPELPTKKQVEPLTQLRAVIAVSGAGGDWAFQVAPPSREVKKGGGEELRDGPATLQAPPATHEIVSTDAEPDGIGTLDHVAPPSLVTTSSALSVVDELSGLGPTATHAVGESHETLRSTPVPPLTNR